MSEQTDPEVVELAKRILEYWREQPNPSDELKGISMWLAKQELQRLIPKVKDAIEYLQREDVVSAQAPHPGSDRTVYAIRDKFKNGGTESE